MNRMEQHIHLERVRNKIYSKYSKDKAPLLFVRYLRLVSKHMTIRTV